MLLFVLVIFTVLTLYTDLDIQHNRFTPISTLHYISYTQVLILDFASLPWKFWLIHIEL